METVSIDKIISLLNESKKPLVILIDGIGGSGKSTIAQKITSALSNSLCINLDAYSNEEGGLYSHKSFQNNFNLPYEDIGYDRDRITQAIAKHNPDVTVLESCFSFKFINFLDVAYRIWISADNKVAKDRLIDREGSERGDLEKSIIVNSVEAWQKCEERYISQFNPKGKADFIVIN